MNGRVNKKAVMAFMEILKKNNEENFQRYCMKCSHRKEGIECPEWKWTMSGHPEPKCIQGIQGGLR
jgi:hypothetical protein